jgi:hypothetical protein
MKTEDTELWDAAMRVVEAAREKTAGTIDPAVAAERMLLFRALDLLKFHRRDSTGLTFLKVADREWLCDGFTVSLCIEKLQGERSRVVVEMSDTVADEIRHKFGLMRVPAPLDATEAIVRATHSLASAADKLADVLNKPSEHLQQIPLCVCGHDYVSHRRYGHDDVCKWLQCGCRKWERA